MGLQRKQLPSAQQQAVLKTRRMVALPQTRLNGALLTCKQPVAN
jgi:hypothetical protein